MKVSLNVCFRLSVTPSVMATTSTSSSTTAAMHTPRFIPLFCRLTPEVPLGCCQDARLLLYTRALAHAVLYAAPPPRRDVTAPTLAACLGRDVQRENSTTIGVTLN